MSSALHPSAWRAQSPVLAPFIPQTSLDFPPQQDDFEMFKSLPRQLHLHCVQRLFLTACFVKINAFNTEKGKELLHFHHNAAQSTRSVRYFKEHLV